METTLKFTLRRVELDRGGYDSAGAYWGVGHPLYAYCSDDGAVEGVIRLDPDKRHWLAQYPLWTGVHNLNLDRETIKSQVRDLHPGARFYR